MCDEVIHSGCRFMVTPLSLACDGIAWAAVVMVTDHRYITGWAFWAWQRYVRHYSFIRVPTLRAGHFSMASKRLIIGWAPVSELLWLNEGTEWLLIVIA